MSDPNFIIIRTNETKQRDNQKPDKALQLMLNQLRWNHPYYHRFVRYLEIRSPEGVDPAIKVPEFFEEYIPSVQQPSKRYKPGHYVLNEYFLEMIEVETQIVALDLATRISECRVTAMYVEGIWIDYDELIEEEAVELNLFERSNFTDKSKFFAIYEIPIDEKYKRLGGTVHGGNFGIITFKDLKQTVKFATDSSDHLVYFFGDPERIRVANAFNKQSPY